jgi:outer membrane protein OmpA-like peptidoglycan-associated protein
MKRVFLIVLVIQAVAGTRAWAQGSSPPRAERPATATYWGDTGLWFVPTAEVVRPKGFSFSVYRTDFDFKQGLTNVSDWPVTLAVGAGPRVEIFGALRAVTRIDRDTRPLFQPGNVEDGGLINDRPFVREEWSGNDLGDLFLGGKINLLTEHRQQPVALAFRGTVKVPTADADKGAGSGEYDYFADVVLSKEIHRLVEISGFGGYAWRGDPPDIKLSDGFRYGIGAAFGARANVRLTTELFGESSQSDEVTAVPGALTAVDGSQSPVVSRLDQGVTTALGLTWQHSSGLSLGAGVTYQFGLGSDSADPTKDHNGWGMQFRLGFHRGVSVFVPPAPPFRAEAPPQPAPEPVAAAPAPAPPPPPANRAPTIRAVCDPCRVTVGQASSIRADAQDPDGDTLSYQWTTPAGTIVDPRALATTWTAETTPGTVALRVTADDGKGGVVSDTVNIEVVRPTLKASFEDVLFDLDRSNVRNDARVVLDRVARTLNENPEARLRIDGHASEEGTAEYNQALSERRAHAVREYLVGHGVVASRLVTEAFGETRPKYDNSREETRRLNRRAELKLLTEEDR